MVVSGKTNRLIIIDYVGKVLIILWLKILLYSI